MAGEYRDALKQLRFIYGEQVDALKSRQDRVAQKALDTGAFDQAIQQVQKPPQEPVMPVFRPGAVGAISAALQGPGSGAVERQGSLVQSTALQAQQGIARNLERQQAATDKVVNLKLAKSQAQRTWEQQRQQRLDQLSDQLMGLKLTQANTEAEGAKYEEQQARAREQIKIMYAGEGVDPNSKDPLGDLYKLRTSQAFQKQYREDLPLLQQAFGPVMAAVRDAVRTGKPQQVLDLTTQEVLETVPAFSSQEEAVTWMNDKYFDFRADSPVTNASFNEYWLKHIEGMWHTLAGSELPQAGERLGSIPMPNDPYSLVDPILEAGAREQHAQMIYEWQLNRARSVIADTEVRYGDMPDGVKNVLADMATRSQWDGRLTGKEPFWTNDLRREFASYFGAWPGADANPSSLPTKKLVESGNAVRTLEDRQSGVRAGVVGKGVWAARNGRWTIGFDLPDESLPTSESAQEASIYSTPVTPEDEALVRGLGAILNAADTAAETIDGEFPTAEALGNLDQLRGGQ